LQSSNETITGTMTSCGGMRREVGMSARAVLLLLLLLRQWG
jgi:hypothetical protein